MKIYGQREQERGFYLKRLKKGSQPYGYEAFMYACGNCKNSKRHKFSICATKPNLFGKQKIILINCCYRCKNEEKGYYDPVIDYQKEALKG